MWADALRAKPRRRRGRLEKQTAQPKTNIDKARERGKGLVGRRASDRAGPTPDQRRGQIKVCGQIKVIGDKLQKEWKRRWESQAAKLHRQVPTSKEGWSSQPTWIYDGVRKHVATAIFLLRSEVLGLAVGHRTSRVSHQSASADICARQSNTYWDLVLISSRRKLSSLKEQGSHRRAACFKKRRQRGRQDSGSWTQAYWSISK